MNNKLFKVRAILALALSTQLLLLSGCAGMFTNEDRCPFSDKGGCQSVSDVNQMVSQKRFTKNKKFVQQKGSTQASADINPPDVKSTGLNTLTPTDGTPLRSQEIDARMWVAPWADVSGNFHGASFITFVVEKPRWNVVGAKNIAKTYEDEE